MFREITADVRLWNFADEALAERGVIQTEEVRTVDLERAVVDTDATQLVLTNEIVRRLGLTPASEITVQRGVLTTNPEFPDIPLYNLLREADA